MKRACLFIFSALILGVGNVCKAYDESFSKGFVIAVDTRDKKACEMAQQQISGHSGMDISSVCRQVDPHEPFVVAVIAVPIDEFEYLNDVAPNKRADPLPSVATRDTVIYGLPKSRDIDTFNRLFTRRKDLFVTIFRQRDFGLMTERQVLYLRQGFVMKTSGSTVYGGRVASSIERSVLFAKDWQSSSVTEGTDKEGIISKAANIMNIINGAIQGVTSERTSVDFFIPPGSCEEGRHCPFDEQRGLTFGVSIIFRF